MLLLLWPSDRRVLDVVVHLVLVLVVEGRDADDHLVEKDAQSPPVQSVIMPTANDHLRSYMKLVFKR